MFARRHQQAEKGESYLAQQLRPPGRRRQYRQNLDLIEKISNAQPKRVRALKLSRNVGHQNALLAGLLAQIGKADAVISFDADLQDDMSVVLKMIDNFNGGVEIVFAVRKARY